MEKDNFIKFHMIMNKPGNPVKLTYIRSSEIKCVNETEDEATKIGAATAIQSNGGMFYCTEHIDEIIEAILQAEKV